MNFPVGLIDRTDVTRIDRAAAPRLVGHFRFLHNIEMLIAFNKPFGVLCQFTGGDLTLADYIDVPEIYPAGRLDKDSEGLLLLTDDGALQARISSPRFKQPKTYLALVEREPDDASLDRLRQGIVLNDGPTRQARVHRISQPDWLWPREPPVRIRKNVKDVWLELVLTEGRNRQVRRMTAAIGHPTLRLIRTAIGPWRLGGLKPGAYRSLDATAIGNRRGRK